MKRSDGNQAGLPVWDLPIRLFHWSVVLLIALSWWSAEEGLDRVHFWSGYTLLFLLLFRLLWGFAGSSTARFGSFVRGPGAVLAHLRGEPHPHAGHTPLGGLSVVAMLAALAVQIGTGLIQIDDDDFVEGPLAGLVSYDLAEWAHDAHETSFKILLALIALHLAALAFYRLRGKSLVPAMVTGRAALRDGVSPMRPAPRWRVLASLVAAIVIAAFIIRGLPALATP